MKRNVNDLLKEKGHGVFTIDETGRLKDVVKIFNQKRIGALMVVNEANEPMGIVTERDILVKLGKTEGEIKDMNVKLIMTPREKLIFGTPEDSIEFLMKMMTENKIRHIPIVDNREDCKLQGLVSIRDVVKILLTSKDGEKRLLQDYIEIGKTL